MYSDNFDTWGGRLLSNLVPMLEQKQNDEKWYFFRAGQCAAMSSFRVGKIQNL